MKGLEEQYPEALWRHDSTTLCVPRFRTKESTQASHISKGH